MFGRILKGQYDVSEMLLVELIYLHSRNRANFVAVPVFPSGMFRDAQEIAAQSLTAEDLFYPSTRQLSG